MEVVTKDTDSCFFSTTGVVAFTGDVIVLDFCVDDDVIDLCVEGGEEQLKMSSPYFAISSLRLKVGAGAAAMAGAGEAADDDDEVELLSDGGLSDVEELDNNESFSPSELLSLVKLVLTGGLVGGEAVLKRW